jgi:5'-deoxynucleotidase YfbR-like HD superfamily hydrolase
MRTITGQLSPIPSNGETGIVCPFDIVMLLGREPRFGGNGNSEFTVLHHSALVSMIWMVAGYPADKLVYALTHDFHEAYTGDIPSPIKNFSPEVKKAIHTLETNLDGRIYKFLGIEPPDKETKKMIKICDKASLIIECMISGPPGSDNIEQLKEDIPSEEVWRVVEKTMPNLKYVSESARRNMADFNASAYGKQGFFK